MKDASTAGSTAFSNVANTEVWSAPIPISDWSQAPSEPGVYRLHLWDGDNPKATTRLGGQDEQGILYIGTTFGRGDTSTRTVKQRISEFLKRASRKSAAHVAGRRYARGNYERDISVTDIRFSYRLTPRDNRSASLELEASELASYWREFLDLPPLNFSLPQAAELQVFNTLQRIRAATE